MEEKSETDVDRTVAGFYALQRPAGTVAWAQEGGSVCVRHCDRQLDRRTSWGFEQGFIGSPPNSMQNSWLGLDLSPGRWI
jgi:hypothetical protein